MTELTEALQSALNALEDSIVILNSSWQYVFLNTVGWSVINLKKSEVLGKSVWDLMPHLDDTLFKETAFSAMKTQKNTLIEEYYPKSRQHFRTKFYPSRDFLTLHITNITDLVEAQLINRQLMGDLQGAMELYWSDANRENRERHQTLTGKP